MTLLDRAEALSNELVELRRDLHRNPELGFSETRTAGVLADIVAGLGFSVRREVGITGVVAELENGEGPTVAIRADMDALPIQETNDHGFSSENPGVMHACGHDAHCACLVGAARLLVQEHDAGTLPYGTIRLLFQPSEEGVDEEGKSGAMRMVDDGAMHDVDAILGLHVGSHLPTRKFFLYDGTMMAGTEELTIEVRGKASHAARPEEGVDALLLAAQGIVAVQQAVSRRIGPMENGIVSLGQIVGGTASNILASHVTVRGTLRYFDVGVRDRLAQAVRASFEALQAHGAEVDVRIGPGYPPVVNDSQVTDWVRSATSELMGEDAVWDAEPMMGGEDFAVLAQHAPGTFFWLGAALEDPREHHSPTFDIDERVLPLGAAALTAGAMRLLRELATP